MHNCHWIRVVAVFGCLISALTFDSDSAFGQVLPSSEPTQETRTADVEPSPDDSARWSIWFWKQHKANADTYGAICDKPKNHDQADLCQQWRSALAAEQQLEWSRKQFWIGTISIAGLIGSLIFTGWAAVAAGRAAQAATDTVRATRDSERARIFCDKLDIPLGAADKIYGGSVGWHPFYLRYALVNLGRTPAIITEICAEIQIVDKLPKNRIMTYGTRYISEVILKPDTFYNEAGNLQYPKAVTAEQTLQIKNGDISVYLVGYCKFRDVFGESYETGFCLRLVPPRYFLTAIPDPNYNYEHRTTPSQKRWWQRSRNILPS